MADRVSGDKAHVHAVAARNPHPVGHGGGVEVGSCGRAAGPGVIVPVDDGTGGFAAQNAVRAGFVVGVLLDNLVGSPGRAEAFLAGGHGRDAHQRGPYVVEDFLLLEVNNDVLFPLNARRQVPVSLAQAGFRRQVRVHAGGGAHAGQVAVLAGRALDFPGDFIKQGGPSIWIAGNENGTDRS